MMLPALLLAAMLTVRFLPASEVGAWLDRRVMRPCAAEIGRIERKHVIFAVAMALIVLLFREALALAGPLDMGLVLVWDASVYIDVTVAVWTIAAATRGAGAWRAVRPHIAAIAARVRRAPRPRTPRSRTRTARPPANDDDGPGEGYYRRAA